jgi:hypothetical protein
VGAESCPKCHRKTWSVKWKSCSGCGFREGDVTAEAALSTPAPRKRPSVTETQKVAESETKSVAETPKVSPGERCPTCKRKVPLTGKQRLEGFRERERLKKEARAMEGL